MKGQVEQKSLVGCDLSEVSKMGMPDCRWNVPEIWPLVAFFRRSLTRLIVVLQLRYGLFNCHKNPSNQPLDTGSFRVEADKVIGHDSWTKEGTGDAEH